VDFSGGSPIPDGGLNFEAAHNSTFPGASDLDTLILINGTTDSAEYSFSSPHDGLVEIDGGEGGILYFSHLEPIIDTVSQTTLVVNGTAADNAITYGSGGLGNGKVTVDNFESIEFSNKTNLVINAGSGNDAIVLDNNTTPTGLTSITVNGELGEDRLTVAGSPGAGSSLASINLNGGGEDDTLLVRPADTAVVNVDGGDHVLGNQLFVDTLGSAATDNGSSVQVASHQVINYVNIQSVTLQGAADLSLHSSQPAVAIAGRELLFTLTVQNPTVETATSVVVSDTLPSGLAYLGSTDACSEVTPGRLSCPLGDLPAGESRRFAIKTLISADLVAMEANGTLQVTNRAGVTSTSPDSNLENNYVAANVLVQDQADLRVIKMSKPDTLVHAGEPFTYTIYVDNLVHQGANKPIVTL
jgi:uncharacterized repeat protein (TIGR01451 family)